MVKRIFSFNGLNSKKELVKTAYPESSHKPSRSWTIEDQNLATKQGWELIFILEEKLITIIARVESYYDKTDMSIFASNKDAEEYVIKKSKKNVTASKAIEWLNKNRE